MDLESLHYAELDDIFSRFPLAPIEDDEPYPAAIEILDRLAVQGLSAKLESEMAAVLKAASLTPALIRILGVNDPFRRQLAARALGRIGPRAREALGILHNLAGHGELHVRLRALDSVRKIERAPEP